MASGIEIGEAFEGAGPEAAHGNTVLGPREGPVGTAWATALATPSAGHTPFVCVLRPGLPAKPLTLFVNKAAIARDADAVYRNNRLATRRALEAGQRREPRLDAVLAAREAPENPFFQAAPRARSEPEVASR